MTSPIILRKAPSNETKKNNNKSKDSNVVAVETKHDEPSAAQSAARGTLATILLRVVSFACTQWTMRRLDPTVLGQTAVQLELVLTTVLFVSREGFRLALTRNVVASQQQQQETVIDSWNVAWLSIPVVTLVAATALVYHLSVVTSLSLSSHASLDFKYGGILYCVASCIEGWGEPAVLYSLRHWNVALKAAAEGAATIVKTFSTVFLLQALTNHGQQHSSRPITAFGLAQVLYACTYTLFLYAQTYRHLPPPKRSPWDATTCRLTFLFTVQGFFKHLLTEGDRFVLTALSNDYEQGVYAMGSAYGGLAARLLLQPLEENARLLWSRFANTQTTLDKSQQQRQSTRSLLQNSYVVLVKAVLYLGLIFSCIAVHYTSILLNILAGQRWGQNTEAAAVLSAFCVYTAFLAANGMTEAFVYAVASSATDLGRMGVAHTAVGLVFAVTAAVAVRHYSTVGLVAANCLAMALRILYSLHFAARYFQQQQSDETKDKPTPSFAAVLGRLLQQMSPPVLVWGAFACSWAATRTSLALFVEQTAAVPTASLAWYKAAGFHVGVGAACAIGTLSLAYFLETSFRRTAVALFKGRKLD